MRNTSSSDENLELLKKTDDLREIYFFEIVKTLIPLSLAFERRLNFKEPLVP